MLRNANANIEGSRARALVNEVFFEFSMLPCWIYVSLSLAETNAILLIN